MLSLFLHSAVLNYKLRDQLHWLLLLTSVGRSSADLLFGMLEGKPEMFQSGEGSGFFHAQYIGCVN